MIQVAVGNRETREFFVNDALAYLVQVAGPIQPDYLVARRHKGSNGAIAQAKDASHNFWFFWFKHAGHRPLLQHDLDLLICYQAFCG